MTPLCHPTHFTAELPTAEPLVDPPPRDAAVARPAAVPPVELPPTEKEPVPTAEKVRNARLELEATYRQRLETLTLKCAELGLADQAQQVRRWLPRRRPDQQLLFLVDAHELTAGTAGTAVENAGHATPAGEPGAKTDLERQFQQRFRRDRQQQASALFDLAQKQLQAGLAAAAYQTLHAVLREDPDHALARRILGYRKTGNRWTQNEDGIRRRNATTTHPRFGWRRGSYWLIESAHFRISTNHSAAAGEKLARQLELLHSAWQQLFFDFWSNSESLAARFSGEDRPLSPARKYQVVLFRDRNEYQTQLARMEPRIQVSNGYYTSEQRTAFFFAGDPSVEPNWWHEVTHQLFHESPSSIRIIGERRNMWAIEGIAVYMESLRSYDDYVTLGGFDSDRLQFARYRVLRKAPSEPLASLVNLGRNDLQARADLGELYTQSAWLCHALLDGPQATRTAPALIRLLSQIYQGRDDSSSLTSLTDLSFAELEADATASLQLGDAELVSWQPPPGFRNLCLGMTTIGDPALKTVGLCTELQWLDLAFTQVTDQGVRTLQALRQLQRLSLEGTSITDAGLAELADQFPALTELDVAHTSITDRSLAQIARCTQLKTLYLTKTAITDQGLAALERLSQLELLDLQATSVTPAAVARLRQKLPGAEIVLE